MTTSGKLPGLGRAMVRDYLAARPAQPHPQLRVRINPPADGGLEDPVAAFAAEPGTAVVGLDGRMLDIPHLKQAQSVLERASP